MAELSKADSLLLGLNPPQLAAVTSRDGVVMVLAGAGSGKTRALTRRLAYLLATGAARPEEILAVTFTNKAAREMRERVADLLSMDEMGLRRLWIGTFHGLGSRIIRNHASLLGYDENFTILDAADQERLVKRLAEEMEINDPFWTAQRLTSSIARWKDDGLQPEELTMEVVRFKKDLQMVSGFYQRYQEELKRVNSLDFGDLLLQCLHLWNQHPTVLEQYRHRFRYILVDEYQDTNRVQYLWLRYLASGHGNLCVVGDDDQSIYSWRGARMDNILDFKKDYPNFQIIRLEQNYRSTANILSLASQLISNNKGRMGKTLWTNGADGPLVEKYVAEDGEDEARFVANEIMSQCKDGDYQKVAILVRASRQTRALEESLMRANIPYQVVGGLRFLDRAEIKDAVAYLRLIRSQRDDLAFERVVNVPKRGMGPVVLQTIRETAQREGISQMEAAERLCQGKELRPSARASLENFSKLIRKWQEYLLAGGSLVGILEGVLQESGYLESIRQEERATEKIENLQELAAQISRYQDLTLFLEDAALISDLGETENTLNQDRVVISTLHAAKGLEFAIVFLVGLEEGLLPHQRALEEGRDALEEERRLLYVGITRAREKLFLTHAKRRWMFKQIHLSDPSRFLMELPRESISERKPRVSSSFGFSADGGRQPWAGGFRKRW
ncbi:MAG: UvrD-helicase domain-containing protein [Magnetococcales bacterium]|nr:UvrD-helicase domain-containing protein [Magnetococcales bacterium]NGZ27898.1 UvrD-helicase domain-containing protein [Magnetococcales bacterium]